MDSVRPYALTIVLFAAGLLPAPYASAGEMSRELRGKLSGLAAGQTIPVVITLALKEDPFVVRSRAGSAGGMIRSLRDSSTSRFERIRRRMGAEWTPGPAKTTKIFWINQTIAISANRGLIEALTRDPDVALIEEDEALFTAESPESPVSIEPVATIESSGADGDATSTVPWNISITGVDSVWAVYGFDGYGVVIGSLDTGIDPSHPALLNKMRPGDSWKDIIFGQPAPYDNLGHGTFGAGILAGGSGGAGAVAGIGIAYRSKLIVCKMLDAGATSISQVNAAMQWMLDPDGDPNSDDFPRVINNSWFSGTRGSTYAYASASAWRAAGIIPVFCAGNSGPATGSTRSPGDYKNTLSIGGTDALDGRYDATSVGPSPPDTTYFPADGRKPDLSAPGESVTSSQVGGGYGASSGTSWSAPHVSGVIALMLQANRALDYDRIFSILRQTSADLGAPGYDHVFGYGRISAMGAVTEAIRSRINVRADAILHTSERGAGATFEVSLDVMPLDTVRLTITSSDTTEGAVEPGTVTFTPFSWDDPVTVLVSGADDAAADGDVDYSITMLTSSAEQLYDGIAPSPLRVVNDDDEDALVMNVGPGWSLVSAPTAFEPSVRSALFPSSISPVFGYDTAYVPGDTLRRGSGYWLRFGDPETLRIPGDTTLAESVAVRVGWNLVGSITTPIASMDIVGDPAGLVVSQFIGFDKGYHPTDTIFPGRGHWVKVAQAGTLVLSPGIVPGAERVTIIPTSEPPPTPPGGAEPPLTGGLPAGYSLGQNYPNPFNPSTTIAYTIASPGRVRLRVFNIAGQEVAVLVDGMEEAGDKTVTFDASGLPSGVYVYRLAAGSFNAGGKMLLIR